MKTLTIEVERADTKEKLTLKKWDAMTEGYVIKISDLVSVCLKTFISESSSTHIRELVDKKEKSNEKDFLTLLGKYSFDSLPLNDDASEELKEEAEIFETASKMFKTMIAQAQKTSEMFEKFKPLFRRVCYFGNTVCTDEDWSELSLESKSKAVASYLAFFPVISHFLA